MSFKNGKLSAELTASYQCVLRFLHSTCLKYCACHEKVMPGHTKCCTCHAKSFSKHENLMLQNVTPLRNQRPDLLTALMNMSLVLRLPRKMHLCRSSSNAPYLPWFLEARQNPHVLLTFDKVHNPLRLPRETTSDCQKVVRACVVFNIFTSKCASCHNRVHFFDISTSKSAPNPSVFYTFDFEMCFAPQRHALNDISTSKSAPDPSFYYFWLRNVLRATTACNFSSLIWPAGSAPAALGSLLFDPLEPQIIGKTQCFATFPPFRAPGSSFFGDFPFFDLLSSSLLFSDSSHLCFSSVHIVGSLTSKLPSIINACFELGMNWLVFGISLCVLGNSSVPYPYCVDADGRHYLLLEGVVLDQIPALDACLQWYDF